ncbi:MAG: 1,4-dihydroxy-6-naphthoate synthase [Rubripirellula sp.]|nr:1,4-dihydroxy-6-naphthoate synthase [Rubripirellula sp.]
MTDHQIHLAISTCPNDTFAFHALMQRKVDWRGIDFKIDLLDIQQLNQGLFAGRFDVAKTSFHAALLLADQVIVLPSGSALGYGVGPLLLAAQKDTTPTDQAQLTLCPGEHTTAAFLFALFHPQTTRIEQCVFSDIMPRLQGSTADFGVCIHEGRFTWQQQDLFRVEDLGERWEEVTNTPLPLGGLVARQELPTEVISRVQQVIRESLEHSLADPSDALETMRFYAQEMDDSVMMQHVELYVNEWTLDLGQTGRGALDKLSRLANSVGIGGGQALRVF